MSVRIWLIRVIRGLFNMQQDYRGAVTTGLTDSTGFARIKPLRALTADAPDECSR
jgi:hypothetical protein